MLFKWKYDKDMKSHMNIIIKSNFVIFRQNSVKNRTLENDFL